MAARQPLKGSLMEFADADSTVESGGQLRQAKPRAAPTISRPMASNNNGHIGLAAPAPAASEESEGADVDEESEEEEENASRAPSGGHSESDDDVEESEEDSAASATQARAPTPALHAITAETFCGVKAPPKMVRNSLRVISDFTVTVSAEEKFILGETGDFLTCSQRVRDKACGLALPGLIRQVKDCPTDPNYLCDPTMANLEVFTLESTRGGVISVSLQGDLRAQRWLFATAGFINESSEVMVELLFFFKENGISTEELRPMLKDIQARLRIDQDDAVDAVSFSCLALLVARMHTVSVLLANIKEHGSGLWAGQATHHLNNAYLAWLELYVFSPYLAGATSEVQTFMESLLQLDAKATKEAEEPSIRANEAPRRKSSSSSVAQGRRRRSPDKKRSPSNRSRSGGSSSDESRSGSRTRRASSSSPKRLKGSHQDSVSRGIDEFLPSPAWSSNPKRFKDTLSDYPRVVMSLTDADTLAGDGSEFIFKAGASRSNDPIVKGIMRVCCAFMGSRVIFFDFDPREIVMGSSGMKFCVAPYMMANAGSRENRGIKVIYCALPPVMTTLASRLKFLAELQVGMAKMDASPEVDEAFKAGFAEAMATLAQWSMALHEEGARHTQDFVQAAYWSCAVYNFLGSGKKEWLTARQQSLVDDLKGKVAIHCLTPGCFGLDRLYHTDECLAAKPKPVKPSTTSGNAYGGGRGSNSDYTRRRDGHDQGQSFRDSRREDGDRGGNQHRGSDRGGNQHRGGDRPRTDTNRGDNHRGRRNP